MIVIPTWLKLGDDNFLIYFSDLSSLLPRGYFLLIDGSIVGLYIHPFVGIFLYLVLSEGW